MASIAWVPAVVAVAVVIVFAAVVVVPSVAIVLPTVVVAVVGSISSRHRFRMGFFFADGSSLPEECIWLVVGCLGVLLFTL